MKSTCKTYNDGIKIWRLSNGDIHRKSGPAVEYTNGDKLWYLNNKCHREDGPAVEYSDGTKCWYYHGKSIDCKTNEEFLKLIKLKAFW